jgi:HAD superfamily hydrolase (TIGR01484 family)
MAETLRAGLFDWDGTLKTKEGVPQEVLDGLDHLHRNNVLTTLVTGRGYARIRESVKGNWDKIVTPNTPVMLENGGRFADRDGSENMRYFPLQRREIAGILEAIPRGEVDFMAYFPEAISQRAVIWTPNASKAEELAKNYGHFADISAEAIQSLEKRMRREKPCMLAIRADFATTREYPTDLSVTTNEGFININSEGVDKGRGVIEVSDMLDLSLAEVLVAGNDHNDIPMLSIPGTQRVIVGQALAGVLSIPPGFTSVATPADLGKYLQQR